MREKESMRNEKPILLVEDDRVDAMTVKRALREIDVTNTLHRVGNGEEALAYLREPDNERPGIILLDLNMPRMGGLEFLEAARQDNLINRIPVIILTTSKEQVDKYESFDLGVAGYMVKPVDYDQFVGVMRTIRDYWTTSEMPE